MNLAVFLISVSAIGVGIGAVFGWPWSLVVVGGIMASVTLLATASKGRR